VVHSRDEQEVGVAHTQKPAMATLITEVLFKQLLIFIAM